MSMLSGSTPAKRSQLAAHLQSLGASAALARGLVADLTDRAGLCPTRLAAAARMVKALVSQGRIEFGDAAVRAVEDLLLGRDTYIPASFWPIERA